MLRADEDLGARISAARTAADHEAIAAAFEKEAKDLEASAAHHRSLAEHYGADAYPHSAKPALKKHCETLAASIEKGAGEAAALAKAHHEIAKGLAK